MSVALGIIGVIAGIVVGIAYGFATTYNGVNKHNTFADSGNPELPPIPPPSKLTSIGIGLFGLILTGVGAFVVKYGVTNFGKSASELTEMAGPNVTISTDAGGLVVFGGFMVFMGVLLLIASIQGASKK